MVPPRQEIHSRYLPGEIPAGADFHPWKLLVDALHLGSRHTPEGIVPVSTFSGIDGTQLLVSANDQSVELKRDRKGKPFETHVPIHQLHLVRGDEAQEALKDPRKFLESCAKVGIISVALAGVAFVGVTGLRKAAKSAKK